MKAIYRWLSCLAFVVLCAQVVAQSTEDRISELETQMKEVGSTNPTGTFGADFAPGNPEIKSRWNLNVEPLYWHAKAGGTEYAYTDKGASELNDFIAPPISGRVKDQEFGWEWGLRVGIGRQFEDDNWDVYLDYTWYEADDSTNVSKDVPSAVLALRISDVAPFKSAKSHYDLNYNNINLEIGRHYFMSSKVSVRPQIGLKSAWIFDRQNVRYTLSLLPNLLVGPGADVKTKDKSVFWGMGPRTGVEVQGYIGDGFSLVGKLAGALLYGYFRASYHQNVDPTASTFGEDFKISIKGNQHLFVPTVQAMLGLIWESYINERRQHLTLGAGYEVEYFWRANQMLQTDDVSNGLVSFGNRRFMVSRYSEDIMFYGLTLKARLDF